MKGLLHHKNLAAFPAAFFCGLIAIPATGGSAPHIGRSIVFSGSLKTAKPLVANMAAGVWSLRYIDHLAFVADKESVAIDLEFAGRKERIVDAAGGILRCAIGQGVEEEASTELA